MGLLQEVVYNAATKLECQIKLDKETQNSQDLSTNEVSEDKKDPTASETENNQEDKRIGGESSSSDGEKSSETYDIFLQLPQSDLRNLCSLLGREGYCLSFTVCSLIFIFCCSHHLLLMASILSSFASSFVTTYSHFLLAHPINCLYFLVFFRFPLLILSSYELLTNYLFA